MGFRFIRQPDGGDDSKGNPPSLTQQWKAIGSTDRNFVHSYAMGGTPGIISTIYGNIFRQDIQVNKVAYNQWMVDVPYGPKKRVNGSYTWDFDTTGGTVHVTTALSEVGRYPEDTAPNQHGAIAVDGDEVKGTDIVIPAAKFNVQFQHPLGIVTFPYFRYLIGLTGTTNSTPFFGFAPGEVLFLGGRGADGSEAEASLNYGFAVSANVTGLTIGSISGIAKKGWETIWTTFEDAEEVEGGVTHAIRKPKFAYVDQVYRSIDMAGSLGFGS